MEFVKVAWQLQTYSSFTWNYMQPNYIVPVMFYLVFFPKTMSWWFFNAYFQQIVPKTSQSTFFSTQYEIYPLAVLTARYNINSWNVDMTHLAV